MKPKVLCLMGPTASGKTEVSLKFAETVPCEIISVDSAMIYRGMDIGTAKPNSDIIEKNPHHLINPHDPSEPNSVGDFCQAANTLIESILQKNKIPLLVGGTMMYFNALQNGIAKLPSANQQVREVLQSDLHKLGLSELYNRLSNRDPNSAKRINPNDSQRILRALEVYETTGISLSELLKQHKKPNPRYQFIHYALDPFERSVLHERIAQRFDQMLANGFIEEVKHLYERGDLHPDLPSIRCVGYRQAWDYLAGKIDKSEMREKAIAATRQLAKRQLTWLRSWKDLHVLNSHNIDKLYAHLAFP